MIGNGFNRAGGPYYGRSAWQDMQYRRAAMACSLQQMQSAFTAINAAFSAAHQNHISGMAVIAAKTAISRIQAAQKAKIAEANQQVAAAQAVLSQAGASTSSTGTSNVLNKIA